LNALLNTRKLARELSKYHLLIIVNPDVGSMPAYHLAKRYNPRLKALWTFHGLTPVPFIDGFRDRMLMRFRKTASMWSMMRADLVQVFSDFIKGEVSGWGMDPDKVVVLPFGIEPGRMGAGDGRRVRNKYSLDGRFLLLYVGRLVNFKHVDELMKAVAGLDDACLLVVGGGPERKKLEALARELRVDGRVYFAGRVPDAELPDYYAACDVFVTASRHEGFCVPVAEAMAAGRPAIVPDLAAMPQTVGEAGLTYAAGDVKGLAAKVKSLAADKLAYGRLSGRSVEKAASYRMENVMGRYVSLARGLAGED
jgi:glycosyltransferase involved in cell wall biosynthesis